MTFAPILPGVLHLHLEQFQSVQFNRVVFDFDESFQYRFLFSERLQVFNPGRFPLHQFVQHPQEVDAEKHVPGRDGAGADLVEAVRFDLAGAGYALGKI
jgi:hypothetical protein